MSQAVYNQNGVNQPNYRLSGYERYQALLKTIHKNGRLGIHSNQGSKAHNFKIRFCNYMLGYRNDDKNELIALAKEISDYYKKVRMYDFARTFDSYRDVLLFGNETIAESWDDTMDLLEKFQAEVIKKRKEELCRLEMEKKENEPSFFAKLFGAKEKNCNCDWNDPLITDADQIAIPRVISTPPGSCDMKNPLLFKRPQKYDACFGIQNLPQQQCSTCPINGRISATTNINDDASINAAARYLR